MMENRNQIQWQPLVELMVVLVTILGSTIPLYMHMDTKIDRIEGAIREEVRAIHEEMKDFHGRLCAIEERRNK